MSVTTTDNARVTNLRHILADYDLHHSEPTEDEAQPAPPPNEHNEAIATNNPSDWPTVWRRVPAYRPVQNQRDEQRDSYQNEFERNFVRMMFGGVSFIARTSQIWRATCGKLLTSDYFVFKIGGEW